MGLDEADETPSLLILGDSRQSIYQFRDADFRFLTMADRGLYNLGPPPATQACEAAEAAFAAFPRLELIASTARNVETAVVHRLAARVDRREDHWQTDELRIEGVVDRIGTGDAFAAGLILRYLEGADDQAMAETALALAAMKHGLPGDSIETTRIELDSFAMGGDVRR